MCSLGSDEPGASRRSPEASRSPRSASSAIFAFSSPENLRLLLIAYPSSVGGIHLKRLSDFPGPPQYRVVLLIPALIPSTLVFVLWKWMYNYQVGPINYLLVEVFELFTFQNAPQWLGGTPLTLPSIAIMEVWWGLGYHAIFFLAGLAAIPKEMTEAARLDGANEWKVFWHVTLPRLAPIMMILVVLRFGTSMAVIDEYLIFGGFNRASPTYTWTIYMYDQAFNLGLWRQGFAAAIGMIGAVVVMFFVAILIYIFRPRG